jgi:DNA-binding IclR family transcriptional regulator
MVMSTLPKQDLVGSVLRATAILETVAASPRGLSPKAISAQLNLNLSTCYHLINTLATAGFLARREDTQVYVLGSKIPYLHNAFLQTISVLPLLVPLVQSLHDSTGETAYLARWQDGDCVISAIVEGMQPVRVQSLYVGYRGHAHAMALGKALLAHLPTGELDRVLPHYDLAPCTPNTITDPGVLREHLRLVRQRGYSLDIEEFAVELCCVGAPILDRQGNLHAAIAISLPRSRYDRSAAEFIETVQQVARRASAMLG